MVSRSSECGYASKQPNGALHGPLVDMGGYWAAGFGIGRSRPRCSDARGGLDVAGLDRRHQGGVVALRLVRVGVGGACHPTSQ